MKKKISQTGKENIQFNSNKPRPENKDNLDSRAGKQQNFKGNDGTHNKKEHHKPGKENN